MSAALTAAAPSQRDRFLQAMAVLNVNAPAAPEIVLHVAAHVMSADLGYAVTSGLARVLVQAAATAADTTLTPLAEAHCQRIARILTMQANRKGAAE